MTVTCSARHEEYFLYSHFRLLTEKLVNCGNAQEQTKSRGEGRGGQTRARGGVRREATSNNASF